MAGSQLDDATIRSLRRSLLRWYRVHRRDLPWRPSSQRGRPDPYHVLVSEAMLQQTQVATVVDYFNRFVARLPTVADLAAADEQQVLALWQGLGYYRRAHHLHRAARAIVTEFGGQVPADVDRLLQLPGVGRYTAGAIASIAHGRRAPILDGNVARVLARWLALRSPIDRPATRRKLWSVADRLVPAANPGTFNEALMELGALVCLPRRPQCPACPVAGLCRAAATGQADRLPRRLPRRRPTAAEHHTLAVWRGRRLLFEQRPGGGLWSRMWQMPTTEGPAAPVTPATLAAWLAERAGLTIEPPRRAGTFRHQTTHRTIRFVVWQAAVRCGRLRARSGRWQRPDDVADLPLGNAQRRALAIALEGAAARAGRA